MEPQYASQAKTIEAKAIERNIEAQSLYRIYENAMSQIAFSYARAPLVYHRFLAERETWKTCFGVVDEFPGSDPLYECYLAALDHIEGEPERHTKLEDDATQVSYASQGEGARARIQQLEDTVAQQEYIIQSKDELLRIKEETLLANKTLMAEKDCVIQIKENEVREAMTRAAATRGSPEYHRVLALIKLHESTIAKKNKVIQANHKSAKDRNSEMKKMKDTLRDRDEQIKSLNTVISKRSALKIACENLSRRSEERVAVLWEEIKKKDWEIEELRSKREGVDLSWPPTSQTPNTSNNQLASAKVKKERKRKVKKEKKPKIKSEPMELRIYGVKNSLVEGFGAHRGL